MSVCEHEGCDKPAEWQSLAPNYVKVCTEHQPPGAGAWVAI